MEDDLKVLCDIRKECKQHNKCISCVHFKMNPENHRFYCEYEYKYGNVPYKWVLPCDGGNNEK